MRMSRWHLLKSAISGKRDSSNDASIHKFTGYNLLHKKKIIWKRFEYPLIMLNEWNSDTIQRMALQYMESNDTCECSCILTTLSDSSVMEAVVSEGIVNEYWSLDSDPTRNEIALIIKHPSFVPNMKVCNFFQYSIELGQNSLNIFVREKPKESGLSAKALLSNKVHNVDNTGNICIWPAESILLHTLLTYSKYLSMITASGRIIELGGGLTALAGLGIASWVSSQIALKPIDIIITDGHPDCVVNQNVCIAMNRQKQSILSHYPIKSTLLHWAIAENADTIAELTHDKTKLFDLIIASDCLFFRDFHSDLIATIFSLLNVDGKVVLLQPQRDGTLNQFIEKCSEYFDVEFDEHYNETVNTLRREYLADSAKNGYNDDIHYPIMIILTRKK